MIDTCIDPGPKNVRIWVDVKALEPVDQLAMDVWLYDGTTEETLRATAQHCQKSAAVGETVRCEATLTPPTPGHRYAAGGDAEQGTGSTLPPPGYVGLQSGPALWPPASNTG
ncbi:hypothetical protein ACOQFL_03155 [Actinopolyspora sp. H202]|uniref:hypothetical protein n=1 Tax=Actinopolyspora sp. H202 TaxID=1500456 RepID=UPI003EE631F2